MPLRLWLEVQEMPRPIADCPGPASRHRVGVRRALLKHIATRIARRLDCHGRRDGVDGYPSRWNSVSTVLPVSTVLRVI